MVTFRALGSLELKGSDGRELRTVLVQPKRLALLAYLALARPRGFHRRDTLLGLFWPESDQERARTALRKAIHFLRRSVSGDAIEGRGSEEIGLAPHGISCDVLAFESAAEEGRAELAIELYRGELLPGLFVSDAPGFERWLEQERARLRDLASAAAWSLADRDERALNAVAAARWARHALSLTPDDEGAHRRLIGLLHRLGDRAGALAAYDTLANRIAEEFDAEPSGETQALMNTVRSHDAAVGIAKNAAASFAQASPPAAPEALAETAAVLPPKEGVQRTLRESYRNRFARRTAALLTLTLLAVLLAGRMAGMRWGSSAENELDDDAIVILPFRVTGADATLSYLSEGMLDLLAIKLTGEEGPRAVDPRTALATWRAAAADLRESPQERALDVAARLGAGRLLLGEVVGTPERLIFTASVLDVRRQRISTQATVEGGADSLHGLVDRLAAELLAREAGIPEHRLANLTSESLSALRHYLQGRALHRRGSFAEATERFDRALALDSTFALAALAMRQSAAWGFTAVTREREDRALSLAWAARDRLGARDHAQLLALAGERYPRPSTAREELDAIERAVLVAADNPELWYALGDAFYHSGAVLGIDQWQANAAQSFARARALDPGLAAGVQHALELAAYARDTATVRQLRTLLPERRTGSESADYLQWLAAISLGDTAALREMRADAAQLPFESVLWIVEAARALGVGVEHASWALTEARGRVSTERARAGIGEWEIRLALDAGRPSLALAAVRRKAITRPAEARRDLLYHALYWDGDSTAAANAARELEAALVAGSVADAAAEAEDRCALAHWRAAHGDSAHVRRTVSTLRTTSATDDSRFVPAAARVCAATLEAMLLVQEHGSSGREAVERLDELLVKRAPNPLRRLSPEFAAGNLVAARLWEQIGEPAAALRAVRRRALWPPSPFYSSFLREEGRLAGRARDREGMVRAYQHFLALRDGAEPALLPEVAHVREELARSTTDR